MGRYLDPEERHQILRPHTVMDELLNTVLTVQRFMFVAFGFVFLAVLSTMALVFSLSLRIREREFETMVKIGGARSSIAVVVTAEIAGVLLAGVAVAALLTALTAWYGSDVIRALIR
jgi:putative ABC transport system permease protein